MVKKNLNALTGTRFIASLMVLLMHFSDFAKFPDLSIPFIKAGGIGVTYFFILSGFILYYIYHESFEQTLQKNNIRNFLFARIFRIYPAYLLALFLMAALLFYIKLYYAVSMPLDFSIKYALSFFINLIGLQTWTTNLHIHQFWNAPAWSVSTELMFYLSFPFFLYFILKKFNTLFLLIFAFIFCILAASMLKILIIIGSAFNGLDTTLWVDYLSNRNAIWRIWEFFIGVILGKLFVENSISIMNTKKYRYGLLFLSIFSVIFIAYMPWPENKYASLLLRDFRLDIFNIIPFSLIIIILAHECMDNESGILSKILGNKIMVILGEISYSLYIYHWLFWISISYLVQMNIPVSQVQIFLMIVLCFIFSAASFYLFETPIRKYMTHKFIKNRGV